MSTSGRNTAASRCQLRTWADPPPLLFNTSNNAPQSKVEVVAFGLVPSTSEIQNIKTVLVLLKPYYDGYEYQLSLFCS
jgi:hypothetical protein